MSEFVPDSIVQSIIERFKTRAEFGYSKYGTNLDRTDLSPDQWAQHALEEAHDMMLYIAKWKEEQAKQKELIRLLIKVATGEIYTTTDKHYLDELLNWYKEYTNP
jgi:hypothetical protein